MCVCVSVNSHLTSGVSVCSENIVTYSAGNGGQKVVGFLLNTPSVKGHAYSWPFSCAKHACAYSIYRG